MSTLHLIIVSHLIINIKMPLLHQSSTQKTKLLVMNTSLFRQKRTQTTLSGREMDEPSAFFRRAKKLAVTANICFPFMNVSLESGEIKTKKVDERERRENERKEMTDKNKGGGRVMRWGGREE